MSSGNRRVLPLGLRKQSRAGVKIFRAALAAAIAFAPVTVALAQGSQATSQPQKSQATSQQRQTEGQRQATPGRLTVPIVGSVGASSTAAAGVQSAVAAAPPLNGSFTIQRFARTTDNALAAVGTLTASFVDPTSNATRTIVTQIAMPVAKSTLASADLGASSSAQACGALGLVLGAIDIRPLSQPVHLDNTTLDLAAIPGTGERFGTLLCAASAQLDDTSKPADAANTLNALLDLIG
jgi:hypothetical protein